MFLPHDWVGYDFDYICVDSIDGDEWQRKEKAYWKREEDKHVCDEEQKVESSLDTKQSKTQPENYNKRSSYDHSIFPVYRNTTTVND